MQKDIHYKFKNGSAIDSCMTIYFYLDDQTRHIGKR